MTNKKRFTFTLDDKEIEQFKKNNPAVKVSTWINEQLKEENKKKANK